MSLLITNLSLPSFSPSTQPREKCETVSCRGGQRRKAHVSMRTLSPRPPALDCGTPGAAAELPAPGGAETKRCGAGGGPGPPCSNPGPVPRPFAPSQTPFPSKEAPIHPGGCPISGLCYHQQAPPKSEHLTQELVHLLEMSPPSS